MTTNNSNLLQAVDHVLDERSLTWAARWIEDSLKGETSERVIEFGKNMATTLRAAATPTPVSEQGNTDMLTDAQVDEWLEARKDDLIDPARANRIEWLFRKKLAASVTDKAREWLRHYDERIASGGKGAQDMERLYGEEATFHREAIRALETLALEPLNELRVVPSPSVREAAEDIIDLILMTEREEVPRTEDIVAIIQRHCSPVSTAGGDEESLQQRCFAECATANWDPDKQNTFAEEIAHLHEELSEAFRAWRRYKDCRVVVVDGKPEGVPIEFADVLIGLFYNAELHGFDLLAAVEQKHQFNLRRNYVKEGRQLHAAGSAGEEGK